MGKKMRMRTMEVTRHIIPASLLQMVTTILLGGIRRIGHFLFLQEQTLLPMETAGGFTWVSPYEPNALDKRYG